MLKVAAVFAVPGALAGGGAYFYQGSSVGLAPQLAAYVIEVGAVFPEAAVRAVLPEGLSPVPDFTGGISIYGGDEGWATPPRLSGHIWLDVLDDARGVQARYLLKDFTSELYEDDTTEANSLAVPPEAHQLGDDGVLHVLAWPDRVSELELVVRQSAKDCAQPSAAGGNLLVSEPDGTLGVVPSAAVLGWCRRKAEVAWVSVSAPIGHALRPFVPQQVLWAEITRPSGELTSDVAIE
jgi:hypothetical protein